VKTEFHFIAAIHASGVVIQQGILNAGKSLSSVLDVDSSTRQLSGSFLVFLRVHTVPILESTRFLLGSPSTSKAQMVKSF